MLETTIDMSSFETGYISGLIFSMVEGLKTGKSVRFICSQDPKDILEAFERAEIPGAICLVDFLSNDNKWVITVNKVQKEKHQNGGCCGLCSNEE